MRRLILLAALLAAPLTLAAQMTVTTLHASVTVQTVFGVLAYGAVCDGSTNDAMAIQAAVDAVEAAGGGTVLFPGGRTCATNASIAVDGHKVKIKGESRRASVLAAGPAFPNGNTLVAFAHATGGFASALEDLELRGRPALTSGYAVSLVEQNQFRANEVQIVGFPNGVYIDGGAEITLRSVSILDPEPESGNGVFVTDSLGSGSCALLIDGLVINAAEPYNDGLQLDEVCDITVANSHIIKATIGLHAIPGAGDVIAGIFSSNSYFDNSAAYGVRLNGLAGSIHRIAMTNAWFSSSGITGFQSIGPNVDGVSLANCIAILNGANGIHVDNGSNYLIQGCQVGGNDADSAAGGDGIVLGGAVRHVAITGNKIGAVAATGAETQARGIQIYRGASDFLIGGNVLQGNLGPAINDGSGAVTKSICHNLGATLTAGCNAN